MSSPAPLPNITNEIELNAAISHVSTMREHIIHHAHVLDLPHLIPPGWEPRSKASNTGDTRISGSTTGTSKPPTR